MQPKKSLGVPSRIDFRYQKLKFIIFRRVYVYQTVLSAHVQTVVLLFHYSIYCGKECQGLRGLAVNSKIPRYLRLPTLIYITLSHEIVRSAHLGKMECTITAPPVFIEGVDNNHVRLCYCWGGYSRWMAERALTVPSLNLKSATIKLGESQDSVVHRMTDLPAGHTHESCACCRCCQNGKHARSRTSV